MPAEGPFDVAELSCVVEVRMKRFASREPDEHDRADRIREQLAARVDLGRIRVWLVLVDGAWSQT
ncbi:MAG: hypothetical protein AB7H43_06010 [Acidimicrobiia bacterium]